jgi:exodeoxyribonuclease V beta subunit
MNEVEFYFPLLNVNPERIKTVFADNAGKASLMNFSQQLDRLVFAPARGFMKGYIDMLFEYRHKFYIVDWKSNFLGPAITDYEKDVLAKEMERSFYILQYHLYTLAVHLLLKMRKPDYRYDQDFGGIFYVFIRGVNARLGPGYGIFSDRPATDMVDALGRTLIPGYDAGG